MARRTKQQIAADALADVKRERQIKCARALESEIKTARHHRSWGRALELSEQLRGIYAALVEQQTASALAAARASTSSEPPAADLDHDGDGRDIADLFPNATPARPAAVPS